jgi:hypothetical protein
MIPRLYELLTGHPWTTVRSMTAEFGPPLAAVYATELAAYTDAELIANGEQILANLRTRHPRHSSAGRPGTRPPASRPLPAHSAR